jgi:hypothetical protein
VNLMLCVILLCVVIGLSASRFGARQQGAIVLLASAMTALYFFFMNRFM